MGENNENKAFLQQCLGEIKNRIPLRKSKEIQINSKKLLYFGEEMKKDDKEIVKNAGKIYKT